MVTVLRKIFSLQITFLKILRLIVEQIKEEQILSPTNKKKSTKKEQAKIAN